MKTLFFVAGIALSALTPAHADIVAQWDFENHLTDAGPSGYDGVGVFGGVRFIGTGDNQYGYFNNDGGFAVPMYYDSALSSLSLSVWFKSDYTTPEYDYYGEMSQPGFSYDQTWQDYVNFGMLDFDRSDYYSLTMTGNGEIMFSLATAASGSKVIHDYVIDSPLRYNDNAWHKVNVEYDAINGLNVYADGIRILSEAYIGDIGGLSTRYGYIGDGSEADSFAANQNLNFYQGALDNITIYDGVQGEQAVIDSFESEQYLFAHVPTPIAIGSLALLMIGVRRANHRRSLMH